MVVRQARRAAGVPVGCAGRTRGASRRRLNAAVGRTLGVGSSPPNRVATRLNGHGAARPLAWLLPGPCLRWLRGRSGPVYAHRHPRRPPRRTHDPPRHSRIHSLLVLERTKLEPPSTSTHEPSQGRAPSSRVAGRQAAPAQPKRRPQAKPTSTRGHIPRYPSTRSEGRVETQSTTHDRDAAGRFAAGAWRRGVPGGVDWAASSSQPP
jgi:hypothetical protein